MTPLEPLKGWLFWVVKKPSSGEEGWREGKQVQVPGPLEGPGGVFLHLHVALPSPTSQEVDTKQAAQGPPDRSTISLSHCVLCDWRWPSLVYELLSWPSSHSQRCSRVSTKGRQLGSRIRSGPEQWLALPPKFTASPDL